MSTHFTVDYFGTIIYLWGTSQEVLTKALVFMTGQEVGKSTNSAYPNGNG